MRFFLLLQALFVLLAPLGVFSAVWTTQGRYILKDGERFYFQGINYSPTPVGQGPIDMSTDDWNFIHERDFPALRAMGCNTIRVYTWRMHDPANGVVHSNFLDLAWNGGVDPVYVFITYSLGAPYHYVIADTQPAANLNPFQLPNGQWAYHDPAWAVGDQQAIDYQINELTDMVVNYGDHPAVIGFVLSNELNNFFNRQDPDFWRHINMLGGIVKQLVPDKLTSITVVDDSMYTVQIASGTDINGEYDMPNLDVWGINSYRGNLYFGFDVIFTSFAQTSAKPLLISEFGPPASTRDGNGNTVVMPQNGKLQSDYIQVHWEDILLHQDICQGGYVFEWTDEWWKHGTATVHDSGNAGNEAFPGGYWDEEWFGINGIEPQSGPLDQPKNRAADILVPRYAYDYLAAVWTNTTIPPPPPLTTGVVFTTGTPAPLPTPYLYYDFEEIVNGYILDQSGNGRDGLVGGNPTIVPGKYGNAISMSKRINGQIVADQYINVGEPCLLTEMTISVWVKVADPDLNDYMRILSMKDQWDGPAGFELEYNPFNNQLTFLGSGADTASVLPLYLDTNWHHIVITANANNARFYVDGEDRTTDNTMTAMVLNPGRVLVIASNTLVNGEGDRWTGLLDDLIIFDQRLSTYWISQLGNYGAPPSTVQTQGTTGGSIGSFSNPQTSAPTDVSNPSIGGSSVNPSESGLGSSDNPSGSADGNDGGDGNDGNDGEDGDEDDQESGSTSVFISSLLLVALLALF